jgi:murein DD-endopeptidase MepM/ murein hydrolase activator NlpD
MRAALIAGFALVFVGAAANAATFNAVIVTTAGATLGTSFGFGVDANGRPKSHWGTDVDAPAGAAVHAPADGVVLRVREPAANGQGYRGETIDIDQGDGVHTRIAGLEGVTLTAGAQVHAGDEIGRIATSRDSTPDHAHVEYWVNGHPEDPALHLTLVEQPKN